MRLYKVLGENGECHNGGYGSWSLPTKNADGTWSPGEWMPTIEGDLVPCGNGYHLCREGDLVTWLGPTIYEAECRGELVESDDKVVARDARLLRQYEGWNAHTARLFACDCAEHVLHIFERHHLVEDAHPRNATSVTSPFACWRPTKDAARDAARAAAWAAAWAAAGGAAAGTEEKWQTQRLLDILSA